MKCKYNIINNEALNKGLCKKCNSFDCLSLKEETDYCYKCNCTGVTEANGYEVTVCNNCIHGKLFEIEQHEWTEVGYAGLERMINE